MARSLCGWTFGWHTESKGIAMADVGFTGIHHIKLPVSDLARSREWYERVLAYSVDREFPDGDGVVRGVAVRLPGAGVPLALRHNAQAAAGNAGFDPVSFAISDRAAAEDWAAHSTRSENATPRSGAHLEAASARSCTSLTRAGRLVLRVTPSG